MGTWDWIRSHTDPPAPSVCKLSAWTRPVTATQLCVRYSTHVKYMFTSGGDSVHSHTLSQRSHSSYKNDTSSLTITPPRPVPITNAHGPPHTDTMTHRYKHPQRVRNVWVHARDVPTHGGQECPEPCVEPESALIQAQGRLCAH